jgi:hypothetical protein
MRAVTPTDLDTLGPRDRIALSAEVAETYLRVRWAMRQKDAERAVKTLRASATPSGLPLSGEAGAEYVAAWRLSRAVRKVLDRLPGDSRCLFKSLTLMCMLERRGIGQTIVIAVRPQPFAAHAWVEVDGQAVLPDADPGYERLMEL